MKRVGFQFKIRQNRLTEYKEFHQHVWPEMLDALQESGWHNYTLFTREDVLIFGYFETEESLTAAQAKMATRDVNSRWQEFMVPFVDANLRPDETFCELIVKSNMKGSDNGTLSTYTRIHLDAHSPRLVPGCQTGHLRSLRSLLCTRLG